MRKRAAQWMLIVCCLAVFVGCGKKEGAVPNPPGRQAEPKPALYCPIDHAELTAMPVRPIVVTIDNSPAARPQSGLDKADIVYEIPAEGGISRYLAVYYHGAADKIGPVRSARPYLVDIARAYDAVYIHAGGSQDALSYLAKNTVPYLNQLTHSSGFWRDKNRKAPHNLYTSSKNLIAELEEKGWWKNTEVPAFQFSAAVKPQQKVLGKIKIDYPSSKISYVYEEQKGLYLRYIDNKAYLDKESGEQLIADNILVQYITSKVLDAEGRLSINLVGQGKALLFTKGGVTSCTWQKKGKDSQTIFTDDAGQEIVLTPGKTWIQMVDQHTGVNYETEKQTDSGVKK